MTVWDQLLHYLNFAPRHVSGFMRCGFAYISPYSLGPVQPMTGLACPPVSSHPSNGCWWHRIFNRLSIAYALRLGLGPGLPWADEPSPGNLRFSAGRILTCLLAYSYRHSLFCTLHHSLRYGFSAYRTLPYPYWRLDVGNWMLDGLGIRICWNLASPNSFLI